MAVLTRVRSLLFMPGTRADMIAKIPRFTPDVAAVDLEDAVRKGIGVCFINSGQSCDAGTRMLVPRAMHDDALKIAAAEAAFALPALSSHAPM